MGLGIGRRRAPDISATNRSTAEVKSGTTAEGLEAPIESAEIGFWRRTRTRVGIAIAAFGLIVGGNALVDSSDDSLIQSDPSGSTATGESSPTATARAEVPVSTAPTSLNRLPTQSCDFITPTGVNPAAGVIVEATKITTYGEYPGFPQKVLAREFASPEERGSAFVESIVKTTASMNTGPDAIDAYAACQHPTNRTAEGVYAANAMFIDTILQDVGLNPTDAREVGPGSFRTRSRSSLGEFATSLNWQLIFLRSSSTADITAMQTTCKPPKKGESDCQTKATIVTRVFYGPPKNPADAIFSYTQHSDGTITEPANGGFRLVR